VGTLCDGIPFSIYKQKKNKCNKNETDDRTHPFVRNVRLVSFGKVVEPWQRQTRAGQERRVGFASASGMGTFVYSMDPWTDI